MLESWYVVKFEYGAPGAVRTGLAGYEHLGDAERTFFDLQTSYRLDTPILVAHGQRIKITGVWLYQVFKFEKQEAFAAVKSGQGDLLYEARGLLVDLEKK